MTEMSQMLSLDQFSLSMVQSITHQSVESLNSIWTDSNLSPTTHESILLHLNEQGIQSQVSPVGHDSQANLAMVRKMHGFHGVVQ